MILAPGECTLRIPVIFRDSDLSLKLPTVSELEFEHREVILLKVKHRFPRMDAMVGQWL